MSQNHIMKSESESVAEMAAKLCVGSIYKVFNPRYGNFTGKLSQLSVKDSEAVIEHDVAGVPHETACNLAYCSFTPV